jgi:hypothetical protein
LKTDSGPSFYIPSPACSFIHHLTTVFSSVSGVEAASGSYNDLERSSETMAEKQDPVFYGQQI